MYRKNILFSHYEININIVEIAIKNFFLAIYIIYDFIIFISQIKELIYTN